MRQQDLNKLADLQTYLNNGGLPDLGQSHEKAGYRVAIAGERYNLGQDKLRAQYRATELYRILFQQLNWGAAWTPQKADAIRMPSNARDLAFSEAEARMQRPAQIAAGINAAYPGIRTMMSETTAPQAPAATVTTTSARATATGKASGFHAALDQYSRWMADQHDKSDSYRSRAAEVMAGIKTVAADVEIGTIDRLWIDRLAQHYKNRPAKIVRTWRAIKDANGEVRKIEVRKHGGPISTYTVKTYMQYMWQLFTWMDANQIGGFQEPRKMQGIFKYSPDDCSYEPMTLDELKSLYAAGTDWQRALILLGATCGQTQQELAAAKANEFRLDAGIWTHKRHKTGVDGSHWLCPELVDLLRKFIAKDHPAGLAFVTEDGNPLVMRTSDAVRQTWGRLLKKADLSRRVTYKHCRKFLGQWMKDYSGEELGQVALQQKSQTVLARHYATKRRNWTPLHEAQQALYAEMQAAGVFGGKARKRTKVKAK